jgi:hypothetical protein
MLPPPLFHGKVAASSIITDCDQTAEWMFHDSITNIVHPVLMLIFRMKQLADYRFCFTKTATYTLTLEGCDNAAH